MAFIKILAEYSNYNSFFSIKNIAKHLEYIRINNYMIKLKKDNYLSFRSIYNLGLVKFEILKTYIKINLINSFISFLKSLARIFFFFN